MPEHSPATLARHLQAGLPGQPGNYPVVKAIRRDSRERQCAGWDTDHWEILVYWVSASRELLDEMEAALRAVPGVYLTTQVIPEGARRVFTNPEWPEALGVRRRDRDSLRPMVIALLRTGAH